VGYGEILSRLAVKGESPMLEEALSLEGDGLFGVCNTSYMGDNDEKEDLRKGSDPYP